MIQAFIRLYKKSIKHSADKYGITILAMYVLAGVYALLIVPFYLAEDYNDIFNREKIFKTLEPENVAKQWVVQENEYGNTNVELVTQPGVHLSLGIHTPNYQELKRVVEEQRPLKVWWHAFEFKPQILAERTHANNPEVYQVSDDTGPIVSFAALTEKKSSEGVYVFMMFAAMFIGLVLLLPVIVCAIFVKLKRRTS